MSDRLKLIHAVTEYDRKQSSKQHYNIYALPQYLAAVQRATEMVDSGDNLRDALLACFNGRLLDVCLKAVGQPKFTDDERYRQTLAHFR